MQIFKTKDALKKYIKKERKEDKSIGFVPTMGTLHIGHLSLIENARKSNDVVVCSIFVNPKQFNNKDDLLKYPRNINKDINLLKRQNCDILFCPNEEEMYPGDNHQNKTSFYFGDLDKEMEGKQRLGHFQGVATIVNKFFELLQPCTAYFGEKDFQQVLIVRKMIEQMDMKVKVISCPIIREKNGLALSSRNERLNNAQKQEATLIYQALLKIKETASKVSVGEAKKIAENMFEKSHLELDYVKICDENTLKEVKEIGTSNSVRAFIAAYIGNIRLIDNMAVR